MRKGVKKEALENRFSVINLYTFSHFKCANSSQFVTQNAS